MEGRPRQFVFDRIAKKDSVEKVEKRLRSEMKVQLAKALKMIGHLGSNSATASAKDSVSLFAQHIQACPVPETIQSPYIGVI